MVKGEERIVINASKDKVWSAVMGFSNYFRWNSTINKIKGTLAEGKELELICLSKDGVKTVQKVMVEKLNDGEELILKTTTVFNKFRYYIRIKEIGENEVEIIQGKEFYGPNTLIKKGYVDKEVKKLKRMNDELKGYVLMLN